jgi:flagellar motor switch protein FliG
VPELDLQEALSGLSGVAKASVLLISLGEEASSDVLQHLTPDEVERLTAEIVRRKKVPPEIRQKVIEECRKALADGSIIGGEEYARRILGHVFGENKAKELLNRLLNGGMDAARALRTVPPRHLAQALKFERPQIVALVLAHLPPDQAAHVLSVLPEHLQGEVALRLTTMLPTDPEIVQSVEEVLLQQLSSSENAAFTEVGGNESIIEILNNVGRTTEKKILDYLAQVDEQVANQIKEKMFTFDDILSLDDRSIQIILRDVPQEDLRLALKGVPENVKEVFFRNMSQRAAETLKEDLEATGPVRLRDVEAAQSRIVSIARQLDEAGEISLRSSGEDMIV